MGYRLETERAGGQVRSRGALEIVECVWGDAPEGAPVLSVQPLSRRVLLVETPRAWWLSDGRRGVSYSTYQEALADRKTQRCLEFGEVLP